MTIVHNNEQLSQNKLLFNSIAFFLMFSFVYIFFKNISVFFSRKKIDIDSKNASKQEKNQIVFYLRELISRRISFKNKLNIFLYLRGLIKRSIKYIKQLKIFIRRRSAEKMVQDLLIKEVIKIHPDVVHCHDLNTLTIGRKIKKVMNCTLIYDSHEIYEHISQLDNVSRAYYKWIQKKCSTVVDYFITVNDSIQKFLNNEYPELPDGTVIKNASPYQERLDGYDGRLHEKAGLDSSIRILLYQGGFAKHRGLEDVIRTAPYLKDEWVLVMMGWGAFEKELKNMAGRLDPERKKIIFIPAVKQNELVYWTQGASIGIIPYENICLNHWYCSPNKLWEYPNAGVPLLVSPFPELKKTVSEHGIGWFLENDYNPENTANLINNLAEDELVEKSDACRKFVAKDNWAFYEKRLVELYGNID